jgi:hypothetical protein
VWLRARAKEKRSVVKVWARAAAWSVRAALSAATELWLKAAARSSALPEARGTKEQRAQARPETRHISRGNLLNEMNDEG